MFLDLSCHVRGNTMPLESLTLRPTYPQTAYWAFQLYSSNLSGVRKIHTSISSEPNAVICTGTVNQVSAKPLQTQPV